MKNTNIDAEDDFAPPSKKIKLLKEKANNNVNSTEIKVKNTPKIKNSTEKVSKFSKSSKTEGPTNIKKVKTKKLIPKGKGKFDKKPNIPEKVEDWAEFKKQKKELKLKRKQSKEGFDIVIKAKMIGEELRRKTLKGGELKRTQLINELHSLLKNKGHYPKFVLAHDTARLVQWQLKYSSDIVIQQISKELIPVTVDMLQSKYGIYCVKRLLKYGSNEVRSQVIDAMLGNAVKLTSHAVSAPVMEYAYSTWATPVQKQYFIQEFFGDLYKNSKDTNVKHLRDTYKSDKSLKAGTLGATKANLIRILNKSLLDSSLVQSVLSQFLSVCQEDDRKEIITQLAPHIVIISNSKDGARAAMQCIWHGTNKDRKVILKAMKEHIVDLAKHEHGHCVVIALLDSIDDTVLLHKTNLTDILKNAKDLAVSEWSRKVLLWMVAPADTTKFHPLFVNELIQGRESSTCKKSPEIRRKEILDYSISTLLELIINDPEFWLSTASLATEMTAIIKAGSGEMLQETYNSIVRVVTNLEWKIKENDNEILGIEHPGMHMTLKKLAQHDKINVENGQNTFGSALVEKLDNTMIPVWLKLNRGCFLLVAIFENGSAETQKKLKDRMLKHLKLLKKQDTAGSKILLKKVG